MSDKEQNEQQPAPAHERPMLERVPSALKWECQHCTFLNNSMSIACSMCNTPQNQEEFLLAMSVLAWVCGVCHGRNLGTSVVCVTCVENATHKEVKLTLANMDIAVAQVVNMDTMPLPDCSDAMRWEDRRRTLTRWLVQEVVSDDLEDFMQGKQHVKQEKEAFIVLLFRWLQNLPLFEEKQQEIDKSLSSLFHFIPEVSSGMNAGSGLGLKKKLIRMITSPITLASIAPPVTTSTDPAVVDQKDRFSRALQNLICHLKSEGGVEQCIESFIVAHAISELPTYLKQIFVSFADRTLVKVAQLLSTAEGRKKNQKYYDMVPKSALIRIFKMHVVGPTLAKKALQLLFVKSLISGTSTYQGFLSEIMDLEKQEFQLKALAKHLPNGMDKFIHELVLSKVDAVNTNLSSGGDQELEDPQTFNNAAIAKMLSTPLTQQVKKNVKFTAKCITMDELLSLKFDERQYQIVRDMMTIEENIIECRTIVDLASSPQIEQCLLEVIPPIQGPILDMICREGSGIIKLIEQVFVCWESMIAIAKKDESEEWKAQQYKATLKVLFDDAYSLIHNLLAIDGGLAERLILWLRDTVQMAGKFNTNIDQMLDHMGADQKDKVWEEADKLRWRHWANQNRPPGLDKIPRYQPSVARQMLLPFRDQLFEGLKMMWTTTPETHADNAEKAIVENNPIPAKAGDLLALEVVYDFEATAALVKRGYVAVAGNTNANSRGLVVTVWALFAAADGACMFPPITKLAIGFDKKEMESIEKAGYSKIWKNLNKSSSVYSFMYFKRAKEVGEDVIRGLKILDEEQLGQLKNQTEWRLCRRPLNNGKHLWSNNIFLSVKRHPDAPSGKPGAPSQQQLLQQQVSFTTLHK